MGFEQAVVLELAIGTNDGVGIDFEIDGELSHRGQLVACAEVSGCNRSADLVDDLAVHGNAAVHVEVESEGGFGPAIHLYYITSTPIQCRRQDRFRSWPSSIFVTGVDSGGVVRCIHEGGQSRSRSAALESKNHEEVFIMRFLSIYMCPERNTPPTAEEMATMGKMVEDWMKSGKLLATEGCMPSISRRARAARERQVQRV